jgi:hypothetical protein
MKRILVALAMVLVCSAVPATAAPIVFTTAIGDFESPPTGSPGTGTAFVTIDPVLHSMRVQVDFSGLLGGVTASHIHVINGPGDANVLDTNGPVATTTPTFTGFPSGVTFGTYDFTFDMTLASSYRGGFITDSGGTTATAEAALFAGILEGRAYLNIHTSTFPGGEIRGFLRQDRSAPEPTALVLLALGAAGMIRRRRSR